MPSISTLEPETAQKFTRMLSNDSYGSVLPVNVAWIPNIQRNGDIEVLIPGMSQPVTYKSKTIEVESQKNFTWTGYVEEPYSLATFISQDGVTFGNFSYGDR